MAYYAASDAICEALSIDFGLMINKANRGSLYLMKGQFSMALKELKAAEEMAIAYDLPSIALEIYDYLSQLYAAIGEQALSDKYFRKCIEVKQQYFGDYPRSMIQAWELQNEKLHHVESKNAYEQRLPSAAIKSLQVPKIGLPITTKRQERGKKKRNISKSHSIEIIEYYVS